MSKQKSFDDFPIKTAILVDGAYYLKRYRFIYRKKPDFDRWDAKKTADDFYKMVHSHVEDMYLYRIFYYDAFPLEKKGVHNPISKKTMNFGKTKTAKFRKEFFEALKYKRKVALRIGWVKSTDAWLIYPGVTKELLSGKKKLDELTENNVFYDIKQKGIDIRIGLDIASLAYKRLVERIVLISGDSDFVPAAKVARREGIDFILDPLWKTFSPELREHIDGLKTYIDRPPE